MEITLEKIELVKDRTGVGYKEAKEALEQSNGNVVDAIIFIEENFVASEEGTVGRRSKTVLKKLKEVIKSGNVSKILIKKNGETVMNIPVNVGIVGTVLAPVAAVAGIITAFGTKCVIEVVKKNGEILDISARANETIGDVVEKGAVIADEVKEKGSEVINTVVDKAQDVWTKATRSRDDNEDMEFVYNDETVMSDDFEVTEDKNDTTEEVEDNK